MIENVRGGSWQQWVNTYMFVCRHANASSCLGIYWTCKLCLLKGSMISIHNTLWNGIAGISKHAQNFILALYSTPQWSWCELPDPTAFHALLKNWERLQDEQSLTHAIQKYKNVAAIMDTCTCIDPLHRQGKKPYNCCPTLEYNVLCRIVLLTSTIALLWYTVL